MHQKDADGMTNSLDPDQTVPLRTVSVLQIRRGIRDYLGIILQITPLTLLHSERPNLYGVLAILSVKGLNHML